MAFSEGQLVRIKDFAGNDIYGIITGRTDDTYQIITEKGLSIPELGKFVYSTKDLPDTRRSELMGNIIGRLVSEKGE